MTQERQMPAHVKAYSKTAVFTSETVPEKITNAHDTKRGVWGQLTVNQGEVSYFLEGQETPLATISAGECFTIIPEERHFVRLSDDAEFFVAFFK